MTIIALIMLPLRSRWLEKELEPGQPLAIENLHAVEFVALRTHVQNQALSLSVLGHETDPERHRIRGGGDLNSLPAHMDLSGDIRVQAEESLRDFGTTLAHEPGETQKLSRPE